ncbi:MAG: FAD-dependent monooxygenase [Nostoc sp. LLA-1]|nr:FAD-dependent monooxygenase [Cyanocohniella sp. LLY]
MRIIISGAGIGGLTLAYWLNKYGFDVVILEKATVFKRQGYILNLKKTGLQILEKMGVKQDCDEYRILFGKSQIIGQHGELLKKLNYEKVNELSESLIINRSDLHKILFENVKDKVEIKFNKSLKKVNQDVSKVNIKLNDGTSDTCDLLIGADGFESITRHLVFGDSFKKFLGLAYFAFIIENQVNQNLFDKQQEVELRGLNCYASCGTYLVNQSLSLREIGGFFTYKVDKFQPIPPDQRKEHLINKFGQYSSYYRQVFDSIQAHDFIYHNELTQIEMPTWSKGRVALIGDAAYCMTLMSGKGASMAMAGAYILAKKLAEYQYNSSGYQLAFKEYEQVLRDKIIYLQQQGVKVSKLITATNYFSYILTNAVVRIIPQSLIVKQLINLSNNEFDIDDLISAKT